MGRIIYQLALRLTEYSSSYELRFNRQPTSPICSFVRADNLIGPSIFIEIEMAGIGWKHALVTPLSQIIFLKVEFQ